VQLLAGCGLVACTPGSMLSQEQIQEIRLKRYLAGLPVSLEYPSASRSYTVGQASSAFVPEFVGREKFIELAFTIDPALPLGLVLDSRTGLISGVALQPSASQSYTVSLYGDGELMADADFSIAVIDLAPLQFDYPGLSIAGGVLELERLASLDSGVPQFESGGGIAVSYSVTPPLPAGLSLDESTGEISGAPLEAVALQIHTITAVNSGGSVDLELSLTVLEPLPAAPTSLSAVPGDGSVALSWQAPAQPTGSLETISYTLERRVPAGSGAWGVAASGLAAIAHIDSGLSNGVAAEYRVRAVHSRGPGPASLVSVAVPVAVPQPVLSSSSISLERGLALDPPLSVGPAQAEGPIVSCTVDPALPAGLVLVSAPEISGCRISGVPTTATSGAQYTLTALNPSGSADATFSLEIRDPVPAAPGGLTATILSGESIRLNWSDTCAFEAGFRVERRRSGEAGFSAVGSLAAAGSTQWMDSGLTPLEPVEYRVITVALGAESAASSEVTITPMEVPAAPVASAGGAIAGGAHLTWTAIAGPGTVHYEIYRDGSRIASLPNATLEHTEVGLTPGVAYQFSVRAVNAAGASTESNTVRIIPFIGFSDHFSLIAVGGHHTCRIREDQSGRVECWGSNSAGQSGSGLAVGTSTSTPTEVPGITEAVSVSAGDSHTCALLADTTVRCWGEQSGGRLGNDAAASAAVSSPVTVVGTTGPTALKNVRDISAGAQHTCATLYSGGTLCWGSNQYGQLGVGQSAASLANSGRPMAVSLSNVIYTRAGVRHTCALLASTEVACWGYNLTGGLGDGTSALRTSPVMVLESADSSDTAVGFAEITLGYQFTCARMADATAKCWGRNLEEQLGDQGNMNAYYPVAVYGVSGIRQIRSGYGATCVIRRDVGSEPALERVSCWGLNTSGEHGNGTQGSSGIVVNSSSTAVDSDLGWSEPAEGDPVPELALGASARHVYVSEGNGWLWGLNDEGQAGAGGGVEDRPASL
jgi:alpha-tubulin suppressor-like RCC1 family protein